MRPGGYFFASKGLGDRFVVIGRFERAKIKFANVNGFLWVVATTLSTLEMRKKRALIHNQAGKKSVVPPRAARISKSRLSISARAIPDLELAPGRLAQGETGCRGIVGPVPPPLLMECRRSYGIAKGGSTNFSQPRANPSDGRKASS